MNEHEDEFLRALDLEDSLPNVSAAQVEANIHRRRLYLALRDKKTNPIDKEYSDMQLDMYINKMIDPNYRSCPSADWLK